MEWKVLYDKILVKRHSPDEMIGATVVPEAAKQEKNTGVVLETGRGRPSVTGALAKLQIEKGMEVMFSKFGGVELEDGNPELVILREDEILAWRWPEEGRPLEGDHPAVRLAREKREHRREVHRHIAEERKKEEQEEEE
jgi:chaperonin GroES